jgi:hypothetical protein
MGVVPAGELDRHAQPRLLTAAIIGDDEDVFESHEGPPLEAGGPCRATRAKRAAARLRSQHRKWPHLRHAPSWRPAATRRPVRNATLAPWTVRIAAIIVPADSSTCASALKAP